MEKKTNDIFNLDIDLNNTELLDLEIHELENRLAFDDVPGDGCTSGCSTCTPSWD